MTLAQDVRFALRMIRKDLWFSLAIVVTLALGIGVNTTVFSLVNAVLRKPLPFPGGDRLTMVRAVPSDRPDATIAMSYADARDFRKTNGTFERLELMSGRAMTLAEKGNPPERFRGGLVSSGIFDMLHAKPVLGRSFMAADEKPGAEAVVIIGAGVWADRYAKSPNVIGRSVRLNDKPATIIGVMPEGFKFPNNEDMWAVAVPDAEMEKRNNRSFILIGILKQGKSTAEAQADLAIVAKRLQSQFPDTHKNVGISVQTFHEAMNGGTIRLVFLLMLGAVGFVLLIACANVANMLLSKSLARARELSIRAALGAGRWRLVRQLLVESVILSVLGGFIGLLMAGFGINWFSQAVSNVGKPYWIEFSIDHVVLAYFALVSIASGIIFGLAPAWKASRIDLNESLKEGGRSASGMRGGYLSASLVVFQFALAVVLLSGAGLMIRSFLNAQQEYANVRAEWILHARVSLPTARYATPASRQQFFDRLMPALASAPGAEDVALVSNPPGMGAQTCRFELQDFPVADKEQRPSGSCLYATPGYFDVVDMKVLQGRNLVDTDGLAGQENIIVSRQLAARYFPKENPIGKRLRFFNEKNEPKPWLTIVGIAPELRQEDPSGPVRPIIVIPYRLDPQPHMAILVRASGEAGIASLTSSLRRQLSEADQELPLYDVSVLRTNFERNRWHLRVFGTLFLTFALIALGMAAVGIYAVMAHSTGQRRREIGVRMALGADTGDIMRGVMGRGLKQLAIGTVIGAGAAIAVCRLMARMLFKVSPTDPVTITFVIAVLLGAGLLACWLPARRAARLNPVQALRYE